MTAYLIKRILTFIPLLFVIASLSYCIIGLSAVNPAERMASGAENQDNYQAQISYWEQKFNLNQPIYYFEIKTLSEDENSIGAYIPSIKWNGLDNRFHYWLKNIFLKADFGHSYHDGSDIKSIIFQKLPLSLAIGFASLLLSFLIAIPIGIAFCQSKNQKKLAFLNFPLIIIQALPSFLIASILILLLANPQFIKILPSGGFGKIYLNENFFEKLKYLILPILSLSIPLIPYLVWMVEKNIQNQLQSEFIKTAKAKGLSENQILYKHALKNAILPLITIFSGALPGIFGGSVIIETLFNLPGMGLELFKAIVNTDYPMIQTVFLLIAFTTLLSWFLADIFYFKADPRIKISKQNNW